MNDSLRNLPSLSYDELIELANSSFSLALGTQRRRRSFNQNGCRFRSGRDAT